LRKWFNTLLRLIAGTYFVLTSLYCLLAFLPYTFYFLIKAPPYAWMPWFVHHQATLYWLSVAAAIAASWDRQKQRLLPIVVVLGIAGIYVTFRPFLPSLEDNRAAYWWSLVSLLPLIALSLKRQPKTAPSIADNRPFGYSAALLTAFVLSGIYLAGAKIHFYTENELLSFHWTDIEVAVWSLLSHGALAIAVLSVVNLVFVLTAKSAKPHILRRAAIGGLVVACLWTALFHFLENALSFGGWDAHLYSAALALALTLWGFAIVRPFLDARSQTPEGSKSSFPRAAWIALVASSVLAVAFPYMIGGADWSGFFQSVVTVIIWISVSLCVFRLRSARTQYSALFVILVLIASAATYKVLQAGAIFWSRPLGSTDDEISLVLEEYSTRDASFQLARHILGNGRTETCADLCRILREYTNIRDTRDRADVQLVDDLTPSPGPRPNIFLFVIDSMRPDYLGAYNPRVDYTPNLDALARDGIVVHHAYSQYAGTSLSEPAIWSGAMMLHAHYLQPFDRLNSLDRMLHTDGYNMVVSMDDVLREILPREGIVQLDANKILWNEFEIGSTLKQAEATLDSRHDTGQPVFFFAQPKNVHQFARNNVPSPASQHWQSPVGMNSRITYEVHWVDSCLGQFFTYLRQHGMYDNSIIIVTSDHGDATGEFGRVSHSTLIWPEVMRVPLIIHLPPKMREHLVYDDTRLSTLTDISPTLYYLLGHRPVRQNPLYGRPLFAETKQELDRYQEKDLLLASDVRAVYGILTSDGRYLYTTYDSPARSYLFDLRADPNAEHNILTTELKQHYDEEIIDHLHLIGDFYGYKPGVGSLLASTSH